MKQTKLIFILLALLLSISLNYYVMGGIAIIFIICGIWILAVDYQKAIYVLCFYAIIDYGLRKISPGVAGIWDDVFLLCMVALVFYKWLLIRKTEDYKWSPLDVHILIYFLVSICAVFANFYNLPAVFDGLRANVEYILWFFAAFQLISEKETVKTIFIALSFVGFLLSLHAIYQFVAKVELPPGWVDSTETGIRTRAYSIIGSPNILASFFAMTAPITTSLMIADKKFIRKCIYFGMLCSISLALIFTYSRGGWIVYAMSMGVYILLKDKRIIVPAIIAVVLVIVFVPSVGGRITYMLSPQYIQSSLKGGRLVRWGTGLEMLKANPVFGVGLGQFGGAVAYNYKMPGTFYMDNYYLKIAVEVGLVGFLAFFNLIFQANRWCYVAVKKVKDPYYKELVTGGFCSVLAVSAHNFFENIFEVPLMVTMFWLIIACVMNVWYLENKENWNK